jgi:hypothetical protein
MYALSSRTGFGGVVLARLHCWVMSFLCVVATSAMAQADSLRVHISDRGKEIVVEYGPLSLPAGAHHASAIEPPAIVLTLPADGWMRGYVVELVDGAGRLLPHELLHHLNLIAKNRRDLFSNVMLRLGAAGPETGAVTLPRLLGVRVHRGDTLVITMMLHNPTPRAYERVRVRARIAFVHANARVGALDVYPVSVAIGPKERPNVFDLPPGRSEHYWEGSPAVAARILGLSGHLHRYGVALRLEDRTTGKLLWELTPKADRSGEVRAMPVSTFLWSLGKPIRANHVYRLTAIYDNPEPRTIPDGGMGVIGGIVMLPRGTRWPAVDRRHPDYAVDVQQILGSGADSLVRTQGDKRVDSSRAPRRNVAGKQRHQH